MHALHPLQHCCLINKKLRMMVLLADRSCVSCPHWGVSLCPWHFVRFAKNSVNLLYGLEQGVSLTIMHRAWHRAWGQKAPGWCSLCESWSPHYVPIIVGHAGVTWLLAVFPHSGFLPDIALFPQSVHSGLASIFLLTCLPSLFTHY